MATGYGRLFVATETTVQAFVAGSGAVAWVQPMPAPQPGNAIRAAGNSSIFAGSELLVALAATDGAPDWEFDPGADGPLASSAALLGGTLHLQTASGRVLTLGLIAGRPPTAVIAGPLPGHTYRAREPVTFSSEGTSDPDNETLTYAWDFGDGNASANASDIHTYAFPGDLRVRLTVTDGLGLSSTRSFDIHIIENQAPSLTIRDVVQPDVFRQNLDDTIWMFKVRYSDPDNDPPAWIFLNITNETEPVKPLVPVAGGPFNFSDGVDYYWTGTLASGYHTYHFAASDGLDGAPTPGNATFPVYRIETHDEIQLTYSVMYVGSGLAEYAPVTGLIPPAELGTIDKFSITLPANATKVQWIRIEFRYGGWVNVSAFREDTIGVYSLVRATGSWRLEPSVPLVANHTVVANISILESPVFAVENSSQRATATFGVFGQPTVPPLPPTADVSTGGRTLFSVGEAVTFSAAGSVETNDGNFSNLTIRWDFNDGSPTATGASVNHSFAAPGIYVVEVTVINAFGQNATKAVTVTVRSVESTNTFLGFAVLIVGALFAVAVIWPAARRRGRAPSGGGGAGRKPARAGERPRATAARKPGPRDAAPHGGEVEDDVVHEIGDELEGAGR
jgi:PKD repeat protein